MNPAEMEKMMKMKQTEKVVKKRNIRPIGPQKQKGMQLMDQNLRPADDMKTRKGVRPSPG